MRRWVASLALTLAVVFGFTAEASAIDPMTKSGCREALLGQHPKSTDNDLRNFANKNNWNSFYLENYTDFSKIGDYRVIANVTFYNPVYSWQPNAHYTNGYCLRTSSNGIRDTVNVLPEGW